jgi:hypothetical protein
VIPAPQPFKNRQPTLNDPIRVELWAICLLTGLTAFLAGSIVAPRVGAWYLAIAGLLQNASGG